MLIESDFQTFSLKTNLIDSELRLNASSYSLEYAESRRIIEEVSKKVEVVKIEDLTNAIFHRPRFKRLYTNKRMGLPFLMPTDVFMFPLKPRKFVINPPKGLRVKKGWILLTCSGSVGRNIIATKQISECVLSHDIIRIVPKENLTGYLYAYLNTWIGQAYLTKDQYGATVKHIEPEHVANIPIPRIPEIEGEIHKKIMKAHEMIEKAQELLREAERMIYTELGLPEIDEDVIEYFSGEDGKIAKAFTISSDELEYRLDASYHAPIVRIVFRYLEQSKFKIVKLKDLVDSVIIPPRFKRPYVKNPKWGVPYLEPSHLSSIKYFDVKFISRYFPNCHLYKLKKGDVLVVTDGSVGLVSYVTDYLNGWYGSNNFARLTINANVNAGYVVIFLYSEYGQIQLKRETFGGVVNHITEEHIYNVKLPKPPKDIQDEIGNRVIQAYDLRDSAIRLEEEAVKQLEQRIFELVEGK